MKIVALGTVSRCVWHSLASVSLFAAGFALAARELEAPPDILPVTGRDLALEALDASTRGDLELLVRNVGLSSGELPELGRSLQPRGAGVPLAELVRRRQDVLAAIPQLMPAAGWVSSTFGQRAVPGHDQRAFHRGIDIAGMEGTVVRAPADGTVRFAGRYGGFGNYVAIVHGYGIVTKYAHNQKLFVKSGQHVNRGDPIGTMGESGRARGVHLHYEVWINDKPTDPLAFMPDLRLTTGLAMASGPVTDWSIDP